MAHWLGLALIAVTLWGFVGLLQKITTNHIAADAVLIWHAVGYLIILPFLSVGFHHTEGGAKDILIGTLAGIVNSLGTLSTYMALQNGAKASIAIPLTALYPFITVLLAVGFLRERLDGMHWFGVALALLAGVLMSIENPPEKDGQGQA